MNQWCKTCVYNFRLPSDPAKHIIWISLLGIDRKKTLPKLTLICSKHFYDKDFENDLAGRKLLKDGADPVDVRSIHDEQKYASNTYSIKGIKLRSP
ncbi:unnamed protein product [Acanthoscelides obtectus]|uniref:THAP-type domain-containing protein n=1 Tax=Acanthoscelides obtectus TaxID=200917 RepID=A0A9P0M9Q6_ACAOB|nr:unnamed protein product [Acanthoscelides obtectus]CAK1624156.1 hypothetical protein AOBTE_LOCUS2356 [Acanthoscelides obtectus]